MDGGDLLVALLAFGGALLGAGLGYRASVGATTVERTARAREEWGRRFTAALEAATAAEPRRRTAGRALLSVLMDSDLATAEDRAEAAAVLEATAFDLRDRQLHLVATDELIEVEVVEDNGEDGPGGRR